MFLSGKSVGESVEVLKQKIQIDGSTLDIPSALRTLRLFKLKFVSNFNKCYRKKPIFLEKCSKWLDSVVGFKIASSKSSRHVGRPKKSFEDSSRKTKIRKIKSIRRRIPSEKLILAAASSQRAAGNRDLAWVIEHLVGHPEKASSVRKFLEMENLETNPRPLSINDALTFLCHNDLSKHQYQNIRMLSLERGANIYPTYNELREGKSLCYPEGTST